MENEPETGFLKLLCGKHRLRVGKRRNHSYSSETGEHFLSYMVFRQSSQVMCSVSNSERGSKLMSKLLDISLFLSTFG